MSDAAMLCRCGHKDSLHVQDGYELFCLTCGCNTVVYVQSASLLRSVSFLVPLRTQTMNLAENGFARAKRRKMQRGAVHLLWPRANSAWALMGWPRTVRLIRLSPRGKFLDDDNLKGACKSVRDQVASELGIDDGDTERIRFEYASERGPWGVRIEIMTSML